MGLPLVQDAAQEQPCGMWVLEMTVIPFPPLSVCWPWHLRRIRTSDNYTGAKCAYCRRWCATPRGARPVCIYCAMDRQMIPAEDSPI